MMKAKKTAAYRQSVSSLFFNKITSLLYIYVTVINICVENLVIFLKMATRISSSFVLAVLAFNDNTTV